MLPCLCVVGFSGSGKTTLLEHLLPALRGRGLRVLPFKHSGHPHRLHAVGSDSERLQAAGGGPVGFLTPQGLQLTFSQALTTLPSQAQEALFEQSVGRLASHFDLVLVEGWKDGPFPKIEIFRAQQGDCLAVTRPEVIALVTEDAPPHPLPCFRPSEVEALARFIERWWQEQQAVKR